MTSQVGISLGKVLAAKEASTGTKGRWMHSRQHQMSPFINHGRLFLSVIAPQDKDTVMAMEVDGADHGISELLPAASSMRCRLMSAHRQTGIQQEHALFGPAREIAMLGRGSKGGNVSGELLVDVEETGWEGTHGGWHRKAQPHGLSIIVVGILTDDDHFDLRKGTQLSPPVDSGCGGKYLDALGPFALEKGFESLKVGFPYFIPEVWQPVLGQMSQF